MTRREGLREKANFSSKFNKSARRANHPKVCPAPLRKIFLLAADPNHRHIRRIPSHSEGRFANVTDAGWDVVDAAASGAQVNCRAGLGLSRTRERSNGAQTNGAEAYGKTVWFRHPLLVPSCRWRNRSNRIRSAIKPAATVTRRIRRRGDRGISP